MRFFELTAATIVVAGAVEGAPQRPGKCAQFINNPIELRACRARNRNNSNTPHRINGNGHHGSMNNFNRNPFGSISNIRFGPEFAQQFINTPDTVEVDEDNEGAEEMANAAYTSLFGNSRETLPNLADSNSFKRSSISITKPLKCAEKTETGMCRAMFQRYTYNPSTDSCEQFIYGGCGGNGNNFITKNLCEKACLNENYQVPADLPDVVAKSALNNVKKNGRQHGNRNWNKNGWDMGLGMNFGFASDLSIPLSETEEGKRNPCDDPPITEPGFCRALIRTFTYVKDSNKCVPAAFGGCAMGTTNSFRSMEDCEKECANGN